MKELSFGGWIGARLLRKEDARHLLGAGEFIGDIRLPGMQDVAFLRSQVAHGLVRSIRKPQDSAANIFTRKDLDFVKILEAGPELTAFRSSPYPPLADEKVRYAGQAIAACIGSTCGQAEDLCEQVEVDIEQLRAVVDCRAAMEPGSAKLFEHWADNAYIESSVREGDSVSLS